MSGTTSSNAKTDGEGHHGYFYRIPIWSVVKYYA